MTEPSSQSAVEKLAKQLDTANARVDALASILQQLGYTEHGDKICVATAYEENCPITAMTIVKNNISPLHNTLGTLAARAFEDAKVVDCMTCMLPFPSFTGPGKMPDAEAVRAAVTDLANATAGDVKVILV